LVELRKFRVENLAEYKSMRDVPYKASGKTERLVRNVHVVVGLVAMLVQLLTLEFIVWFHTTGFALPIFIIIIGFAYGFTPSFDSDKEYLRHIIEPRVDRVSEVDRARFLQFGKIVRRMVLVSGYMYALIFQLIWISLNNIGDIALLAQFMIFPAFAAVVAVGATPFLMVIERIRYQDIKNLLDADRKYLKSRQWTRT
jgi:hypothetical protein